MRISVDIETFNMENVSMNPALGGFYSYVISSDMSGLKLQFT